jgi:hypothetical protein
MRIGPIYLSSQNLDEDGRGQVRSRWLHGRAWLRIGRWNALRWEWCLGRTSSMCHLGALFCSDDCLVSIHGGLPWLANLYLTIPRPRLRWLPHSEGWDLGVSIHGGSIWIDLLKKRWSSISFRDSFWKRRSISIDPLDLIFGRHVHRNEILESGVPVLVPMPEGSYAGTAKRERTTWTRPRWPWWPLKIDRRSWWIDVPEGVPHPGKGENSWDCGEDGTMGAGADADHLEGAIVRFVEHVLRDRRRYGGSLSWVPKDRPVVMAPARKKKS